MVVDQPTMRPVVHLIRDLLGGEEVDGADLLGHALIDQLRHDRCRYLRNHVIHRIRGVEQGRVTAVALDLIDLGVDRIQPADRGKVCFQQRIIKTAHGPCTGVRAHTDHRHGAGMENWV